MKLKSAVLNTRFSRRIYLRINSFRLLLERGSELVAVSIFRILNREAATGTTLNFLGAGLSIEIMRDAVGGLSLEKHLGIPWLG